MPRIDVPDDLGGWMALRPDMASGLVALSDAVYGKTRLPLRVQEIARMRIALANECEVCRNTRFAQGADHGVDEALYEHVLDWRTWPGYSERERLAAEYAEGFALDHIKLRGNDDFWMRFRKQFRDEEIVDLAFCCLLWLGGGRTMRVLDVGQTCTLVMDKKTVESA
jgi:alkylhydroperoxidase family enzyme